ncbi:MAG: efflux RND transporter permease subunit [Pseudomonadota bacterium]
MIRFFTEHPTAANLMMAAFIVMGLVIAPSLLLETFPRISTRNVEVRVVYPGAAPADVERSICRRIEEAVEGVENVDEVRCEARENVGIATVEMIQGEDIDQFFLDIQTEIEAITEFPDSAEDAVITQLGRLDFVASLVITGIEDRTQLKAYAEDVKDRMLRWGGIPQIEVKGFSDRQFRIEISDAAARGLGLSLEEIAATVSRQNIDLPAGEIVSEGGVTLLRFADQRLALDAYRSIIVASSELGGQIRLADIARITDRFEDEEVEYRLDGRTAAMLDISKTHSDDTLDVVGRLKSFIENEKARAPPGLAFTIVRDSSNILSDRLQMLLKNSLQGIVLVFATMWLFFGMRQAFWIGMGLPVSFLGALAMMAMTGLTINMLSMVGLLIVIGILMDDAIVIAENIATKRQSGLPPVDAAVEGARQVLPGILSSFATTIAIFGSLAFIDGDIGEVLRVIPMVMIMVLAVSLVEAFWILPNHLSHGAAEDRQNRVTRAVEAGVQWLRTQMVGPLATWAVQWRYLTLGIGVLLFLSALAMFAGGAVKFEAFPSLDGDQLEARIELPSSATLEDTRSVVREVVTAFQRVDAALSPENEGGASLIENVLVRYNENSDAGTNGAYLATVTVDMLDGALRGMSNETVMTAWRREFPADLDVRRIIVTEPSLGPAGRAIELRLSHSDIDTLAAASLELQDWLKVYQGVYNLSDDLDLGKPELKISLKDGAGALGLDARMIADQVRAAFYGVTADEVQIGVENYEVDVRMAERDRSSLGDLDGFTVQTPAGQRVPLSAVATITSDRGVTRINRIDRRVTATITGDVVTETANASDIVRDTETRFIPELLKKYPGLDAGTEGQNAEAAQTQASMLRALGLGLIAVFLLLSFQFKSYAEPIVVMVLIPFALIGAVYGHYLMGINFTLPSTLGVISLAGIVVNDSILLVNFIKNEHAPGVTSVAEAAPQGAVARFRAILLTSVTTVAGLIPLLFETSLQAQVLVPLVTSIAFGLVGTTLLIVFVVPAFYTILDDFGLTSLAAERRKAARDAAETVTQS